MFVKITDKVAIVTGASSGIGEATARLFSQKGARVVLVARSQGKLERLHNELPNSLVIVADMLQEEDIKRVTRQTMEHFGSIDVLVNNAGRGYDSLIEDIDTKLFEEIFRLDMLAPALAMREVIPIMRNQGSGAIVNISSGTALMAIPTMSPYSSMKRAIVGLSLTAREELKDSNIIVSVVYPYITKTNFEQNTLRSLKLVDNDLEKRDIPQGDTPDFVAEKILEAVETGQAEVFAHEWMSGISKKQ